MDDVIPRVNRGVGERGDVLGCSGVVVQDASLGKRDRSQWDRSSNEPLDRRRKPMPVDGSALLSPQTTLLTRTRQEKKGMLPESDAGNPT